MQLSYSTSMKLFAVSSWPIMDIMPLHLGLSADTYTGSNPVTCQFCVSPRILLSNACKQMVQASNSTWIIDLMEIFQESEESKSHSSQLWIVTSKPNVNRVSEGWVRVVCRTRSEQFTTRKSVVLATWVFRNYPHTIGRMEFVFTDGACQLISEI